MPSEPLPPDLAAWLRNNADDVVPVLEYLRSRPAVFSVLVFGARALWPESESLVRMNDGAVVDVGTRPAGVHDAMARQTERARAWLQTGTLAFCADCLGAVVEFPTGELLSWPPDTVEQHGCIYPRVAPSAGRRRETSPAAPPTVQQPEPKRRRLR